ncbi:MAG: hypothetical protein ACOC33_00470 [bacterium]
MNKNIKSLNIFVGDIVLFFTLLNKKMFFNGKLAYIQKIYYDKKSNDVKVDLKFKGEKQILYGAPINSIYKIDDESLTKNNYDEINPENTLATYLDVNNVKYKIKSKKSILSIEDSKLGMFYNGKDDLGNSFKLLVCSLN